MSDPKRILLYWGSTRNIAGDINLSTRAHRSVGEIETDVPRSAILTAYSGFQARFRETPVDYREVYVYADAADVRRKFPPTKGYRKNLFVLKPDEHLGRLSKGGIAPLAQIYVGLWQLGEPAKMFIDEFDRQLEVSEVGTLREIIKKTREHRLNWPLSWLPLEELLNHGISCGGRDDAALGYD